MCINTVEPPNRGPFEDNKKSNNLSLLRGCPFRGFTCISFIVEISDLFFSQKLLIHRPFFLECPLKRGFTVLPKVECNLYYFNK